MRIMDVSKVRGSLATIVESVRERGTVVIIIRYGRPIAALVPTDRLTLTERRALTSNGVNRRRRTART
jgi:antitoxin (DNA-binding transcriptional repressor) of toxin-antitoxin stability system